MYKILLEEKAPPSSLWRKPDNWFGEKLQTPCLNKNWAFQWHWSSAVSFGVTNSNPVHQRIFPVPSSLPCCQKKATYHRGISGPQSFSTCSRQLPNWPLQFGEGCALLLGAQWVLVRCILKGHQAPWALFTAVISLFQLCKTDENIPCAFFFFQLKNWAVTVPIHQILSCRSGARLSGCNPINIFRPVL